MYEGERIEHNEKFDIKTLEMVQFGRYIININFFGPEKREGPDTPDPPGSAYV
jgi:hypothetical protein